MFMFSAIYLVFAFQKIYENTAPEPPPRTQANIPSTADTEATGTANTEVEGTADTEITGTADTETTGTADTETTGTADTENQDSADTTDSNTVEVETLTSGTKRSHEEEEDTEERSKIPREENST